MRLILALLAALLIGAAPVARAPDWRHTTTRTADGAIATGNPSAKVQLTEYLSLTCPHCGLLAAQGHETLDRMIADGSLRITVRHAVRDPLDLAATLIARCAGAAKLRDTMDTLFGLQPQWLDRGYDYLQAHPTPALPALADAAGLSQIARGFGIEHPRLAACLANKPEQLALAHMARDAWALMQAHSTAAHPIGTPSFAINGRFAGSTDWDGLLPQLEQAGAH